MTDSHNFEFPLMFLDYCKLHLKGDNATTILEMDTNADLFKSRHLITNQNFVPFHSMKAKHCNHRKTSSIINHTCGCVQQSKQDQKNPVHLPLCSYLETELREPDIPKT